MSSFSTRNPLRILFINSIQMFGGGEIWMLTAMRALHDRGHQVGLVCRPGTEVGSRSRGAGYPTYPVAMRGDFDPITIYRFWQVIHKFRVDILVTNMDKELRLAGMANCFFPGTVLIPRRGIDYPLKNHLFYRLSYQKFADGIIANSLATKQSILQNAPWLRDGNVKVIYNGIDPRQFRLESKTIRRQCNIPKNVFVFGFVGQLDERKGIHDLLSAFKRAYSNFPEIRLIMVGEGAMQDEIQHFVKESNFQQVIHLLGVRQDIPEIMANIDALVLPSLWEGFGIVLIEAMAAGKPVIATRTSNIPEIVQHNKTGMLVPVGDPVRLSDAMVHLAANSSQAVNMGKAGQTMVEQRFTLNRMVDELESYFYSLLKQKRKR